MLNTIVTATGSYIPPVSVPNDDFLDHDFYASDGKKLDRPNPLIVKKLHEISGIEERRYATDDLVTSDIAFLAAEAALAHTDPERLDYIIVAQNLGDVKAGNIRTDMVPTIAARVKHKLRIKNPYTVCMDLPFGCPGWLQGMILADALIKSGNAQRVLVIGAEILSRVSDPHDVDSMIYADGAGATLVEAVESDAGILSHVSRSDTLDHAHLLWLGPSYKPDHPGKELFVKMHGHKIYKYAVRTIPEVIRQNLDKSGCQLGDVAKILIHQANEKMDAAIVSRLFQLYGIEKVPDEIMPMIISWTGNSSVATLPTLLDLVLREKLNPHRLRSGDLVVFASVGAGMNINSMLYRMP
jgi:3-oxoacyl-[acyl-carrier-protein] synthase-3